MTIGRDGRERGDNLILFLQNTNTVLVQPASANHTTTRIHHTLHIPTGATAEVHVCQKSSSLLRAGHPNHGGMAPRIGKWVNTTPIMFLDIGLIAELLAADGRGGTKLCSFERNFPALV